MSWDVRSNYIWFPSASISSQLPRHWLSEFPEAGSYKPQPPQPPQRHKEPDFVGRRTLCHQLIARGFQIFKTKWCPFVPSQWRRGRLKSNGHKLNLRPVFKIESRAMFQFCLEMKLIFIWKCQLDTRAVPDTWRVLKKPFCSPLFFSSVSMMWQCISADSLQVDFRATFETWHCWKERIFIVGKFWQCKNECCVRFQPTIFCIQEKDLNSATSLQLLVHKKNSTFKHNRSCDIFTIVTCSLSQLDHEENSCSAYKHSSLCYKLSRSGLKNLSGITAAFIAGQDIAC